MHYRTLGKTGLHVSEIGFGAWGIGGAGWVGAKDDESLHALNRAIDLGLNFIDTAYGYGDGHSEQLIGQVLRERSERVYVATKIPPKTGDFRQRILHRWKTCFQASMCENIPSAACAI